MGFCATFFLVMLAAIGYLVLTLRSVSKYCILSLFSNAVQMWAEEVRKVRRVFCHFGSAVNLGPNVKTFFSEKLENRLVGLHCLMFLFPNFVFTKFFVCT